MKIEDIAAKHSDDFPGYQLVDYYEAAFPVYVIQLQVLIQEEKPLHPLEEFVLKAIDAGQEYLDEIANLLGLEENVVQSTINNMQRRNHIIFARGTAGKIRLVIAPQGRTALIEIMVKEPKISTMGIAQDALTGKLYPARAFMKMKDVREFELHEIPTFIQTPKVEHMDFRTLQQFVRESEIETRLVAPKAELLEILRINKHWTEYGSLSILQYVRQDGSLRILAFERSERSFAHETALITMEEQKRRPLRSVARQTIPPSTDEIATVITQEVRAAAQRKATELPKLEEQLQQTLARQEAAKDRLGSRLAEEREEAKEATEQHKQKIAELEEKIQELKNAPGTTEVLQMHEHRPMLFKALETSQQRIILVSPWLNYQAVDYELREAMRNTLQRGIVLIIAYGFGDSTEQEEKFVDKFRKSVDPSKKFVNKLQLYRLGDVHSKILICDDNFMIISSFNWLSFAGDPTRGSRVEDGMLTREKAAIARKTQEWLDRFAIISAQKSLVEAVST